MQQIRPGEIKAQYTLQIKLRFIGQLNKEKIAIYNKQYEQENKEKIAKRRKAFYEKNKEMVLARKKAWKLANKEKLQAYNKANMKHIKDKYTLWKKENPEQYRKTSRAYCAKRYNTDTLYRLTNTLRGRIYKALAEITVRKSARTEALLGCSVAFVKKYLEAKFTDGMTWDNYGKWHVDHIKPCASFDLTR